jgi:hypothetical protein
MSKIDVLVCVAGWEQRFVEGLKIDIEAHSPKELLVLVFTEFEAETRENRESVRKNAVSCSVTVREVTLNRDPKTVWETVTGLFAGSEWKEYSVLLDISTMPREVIWCALGVLMDAKCNLSYVYHHPARYSGTWLTRDTGTPRLVYQHSGIAKLGKQTALLLLNGFDKERAARMVQYFEPTLLLVGVQSGEQFGNVGRNREQAADLRRLITNIRIFDIDAFSEDCGLRELEGAVESVVDGFNIVGASLGPKLSAISLLLLTRKHPEIALAYAPSGQFNMELSTGIGKRLEGSFEQMIAERAQT